MKSAIFCGIILTFLALPSFADTNGQIYEQQNNSPAKPLSNVHDVRLKPTPPEGFFFKPFLSVEYSAPKMSNGGMNSRFRVSQTLFDQLYDIRNLALGVNFRVHRYLGFNANWAQTELSNYALERVGSLSRKAYFGLDQYNFSALFYAPVVDNFFEIFAEVGAADMTSKLRYTSSAGVAADRSNHETVGIYGGGFQIKTSSLTGDAVRFSIQKYTGKLALTNANFTTVRIGFLKSF